MRYFGDDCSPSPEHVTVRCASCPESVVVHEHTAMDADKGLRDPIQCEDCSGNVHPSQNLQRWRCERCEKETPHRSYQNPAATWDACAVCGLIEDR